MHNIFLVIKREYLSRVRKKSFLVMTIVGPLLFATLMVVPIFLMDQGGDEKAILVVDESGLFGHVFEDEEKIIYSYNTIKDEESAKNTIQQGKFDGLLIIPDRTIDDLAEVSYYSMSNPSISSLKHLERKLHNEIEQQKLIRSGLDQEFLDRLKASVSVSAFNISESGTETQGSAIGATAVGYIASFMIYMFIFIYGAMCMRGVIEEKSSRIIEIIVASVKPFHLMMGKVLGIASVGLSQLLLWITLTSAILFGSSLVFSQTIQPPAMGQIQQIDGANEVLITENPLEPVFQVVESLNLPQVVLAFVFFFISGYLFYGGLFAAVGSASDSDADAQQFMLPVTIPLILSIMLLGVVLNDPNGSLAFWMSMIPFTAPVVMMMRVAFGVPFWQLGLSMVFMVAGFIFMIWFASRIYR
ncbi:MAG: ABC transporter permease, partial [Cyclobacteriaceae bacterium]|nr:ABC transporter permease [Cyclobacteriaceae bacterium SS2]